MGVAACHVRYLGYADARAMRPNNADVKTVPGDLHVARDPGRSTRTRSGRRPWSPSKPPAHLTTGFGDCLDVAYNDTNVNYPAGEPTVGMFVTFTCNLRFVDRVSPMNHLETVLALARSNTL